MPVNEIDCRGLACPGPVVACSRVVKQDAPAALNVLVDNPAAVENVSRFLRTSGYAVSSERREEALWLVQASRDAGGAPEAVPAPQSAITNFSGSPYSARNVSRKSPENPPGTLTAPYGQAHDTLSLGTK